jgi:AAA+ ATPase superfamily predicted ATPase
MENPFAFGNPIDSPQRFIGRRQELQQIVSRLLSGGHESTSVIGERRMGKTSLLLHLSNPEVLSSYSLDRDHYCAVFMDCQGLTNITPNRFWQRVSHKLGLAIDDPMLKLEVEKLKSNLNFDLFDLEDLFNIFNTKGKRILLFLDEFEFITQNPNFGADFFGGLRSLAIHSNLSLIPATRCELVELCHSDDIKSSPFFNIFATVILRPFSMNEYLELFQQYIPNLKQEFTQQDIDLIYQLSGGYPFFVQMAGHSLWKVKTKGIKEEYMAAELVREFDQQAEPHFDYLWNQCSESERVTLLTILVLQSQKSPKKNSLIENILEIHPFSKQDIPELQKRGLVTFDGLSFRVFSSSFSKWIINEISATPDAKEDTVSVENWLKSGGKEAGVTTLRRGQLAHC